MSPHYGFALALGLSFTSVLSAQGAPDPPQPPVSEASSEAILPHNEGMSTQRPAFVSSSLPPEHVVYVPFQNLRDVFENEDASIVLPYAQFLELWDRVMQPPQSPVGPPVSGVVTRVDYVGSVRGERAYLEATLYVEVLSTQWARIPVEFGDAAIGSAQAPDDSVLLRGVGEGRYELLVHGRGSYKITLGLVLGVKSAAEGRSFTMQCPAVGISTLELVIPEEDLAVQVAPRRTSEVQPESAGATRVRAVLGSTHQFAVSWQPRSGGTDQTAGLANVTDAIAIDVGDGVVHTHAVFNYEILRGSLSELIVELASDQRLLDVQTLGLRDWRTETIEDRQRVTVRLHAPATEQARLELHAEAPIAAEPFQVGSVRVLGVARESGILAIRGGEDVGLEYVRREAITRVDAAEVPESLRKPRSAFYKFFTPDHTLVIAASQLEPRLVVDSRIAIALDKARVTLRGEFRYQVSRSGVFSFAFRLPNGCQVDDVQAETMERFEVTPADGAQLLTVYFTKRLLGDVTVTMIASQPHAAPSGALELPLPEPLQTTREQGLVAVLAPESLEVNTDAARLQSARAATPQELAARGFRPEVPEGSTLAAAFSFVARPVQIVQAITPRPRRTSAAVATVTNVKEDVVQVTTTVRYHVQFAGTDTFRIAVPASASDRLQIEGEGIKERRRGEQADEHEMIEWTIVLHSEALGDYSFSASYDQRISIPDQGAQYELRPIQVRDADREGGEIAVLKDRVLAVEAVTRGLEEIDPRELVSPIKTTQPYLTYRYFQHPVQLTLHVTKHELQEVVRTVVRRAYVEAVVTEDGPITVRARYELRSSERQRLAITLRDPRILGITVAGQSVAPEKGVPRLDALPEDKTYLINVARTGDSDEPFQIAVVFETPLDQQELGIASRLRLALPRFEDGVKFQQVYVRVWVPEDYRLVGNFDGYTSHIGVGLWDSRQITPISDSPDDWFPQDATSFDFQVGGTPYLFSSLTGPTDLNIGYWHIPSMTFIASLAVLTLGGVLVWFSVDAKVFTILAALFGVLLLGMFWPSVVHSWLLSARLGIAGVVAIWLIVWLLHVRRTGFAVSPLFASVIGGPIVVAVPHGDSPAHANKVAPVPGPPGSGQRSSETAGNESGPSVNGPCDGAVVPDSEPTTDDTPGSTDSLGRTRDDK